MRVGRLMNTKYLKILKLPSVIIIICMCYGCADIRVGESDPAQVEHAYGNEEWRNAPLSDRTHKKIAPLISKTVIFSDEKKQEEGEN